MFEVLTTSRSRISRLLGVVLLGLVISVPAVHAATTAGALPRTGSPKTYLKATGSGGLNANHATVQQVIQCMVGSGITVTNVSFTGSPDALGTFTGGTGIIGFESGVILSTGDATSVVGPNAGDGTTKVNGLLGDPCLDGLIPGFGTLDACVLEFDFSCQVQSNFTIQYVLGSEEYNEYVNSEFNDVFGFFLDGCAPANNLAVVPSTCSNPGIPVSINNVNCGNPFAAAGPNCDCYLNNDLSDGGGSINTELDGLTQVLSRTVTIAAGTHHLKIAIADAGDTALDSDVFLACQGLACVCPDSLPPLGVNLSGSCNDTPGPGFCSHLTWNAPSDNSAAVDSSSGKCASTVQAAAAYDIRWSTSPILSNTDFNTANQVNGEPVPASPGTPESFTICDLPPSLVYVALRSRDASFNESAISSTQVNCGNQPPDCSLAAACVSVLWPPNHNYHAISICGVTDPDSGDVVTITVTSVTQDEPTNTRGDGNTCPDAQIVGGQASVRAERTGTPSIPGNGRVYAIGFTADDGHGGQCSDTVYVCVPHDQSDPTCINDGQRYNSLGPCRSGNQLSAEQASFSIGEVTHGQAHLTFALPVDGPVEIAAFDVSGRRLATIVSEVLPSGFYERDWNMAGISKGMYFVRIQAGGVKLARTVIKLH